MKMRRVGFTGRRTNLTEIQEMKLRTLLFAITVDAEFLDMEVELHHGDCVGADFSAANIMHDLRNRIVTHPPKREAYRAYFANSDDLRDPKEYPERNHNIVDETERLIACPDGPERTWSGTWATVRYARKQGKPITIIWPDGRVEWDPPFVREHSKWITKNS